MSEAVQLLLRQAFDARREHRLHDAQRHLTEAVGLGRTEATPPLLALALTRLGAIERDLGKCDAALRHYQDALALYRSGGNAFRLAHTVRHVGDIHQEMQHSDLAEPCYIEALAPYRAQEETPPLDLANTLRGFARLKAASDDSAGARTLWIQARDLYAGVGLEVGVEDCTAQIASLANS